MGDFRFTIWDGKTRARRRRLNTECQTQIPMPEDQGLPEAASALGNYSTLVVGEQ